MVAPFNKSFQCDNVVAPATLLYCAPLLRYPAPFTADWSSLFLPTLQWRSLLHPAVLHHMGLIYTLILSVKFYQKFNTTQIVSSPNLWNWRWFGSSTDQVRSSNVTPHLSFMCFMPYVYLSKAPCETWIFICETAWSPSTCFHTHLAGRASPSRVARWLHGLTMHVFRFQLHHGDTNTLGGRTHQETAATP